MFKKIELWLVLLILVFGVFATYCFGVIVRNIGHEAFTPIRSQLIFALDIPKKIKHQFFDRIETPILNIPESLKDYDFSQVHNKIPVTIALEENLGGNVSKYSITQFSTDTRVARRTIYHKGLQIFFVDFNEKYLYAKVTSSGADTQIAKYSISDDTIVQSWSTSVRTHHEIYVDDEGTIYTPFYTPLDEVSEIPSNPLSFFANVLGSSNSRTYGDDNQLFRADGVLVINTNGKIIHKQDFTDLFYANGMEALIYGIGGLEVDPYHINSVYVAENNFPNNGILKGDLLVSLRHRSMLLIYRPANKKVIWHQIGPWINQHSAKFDKKGNIYVFNNNVIDTHNNRTSETAAYLQKSGNQILYYNFSTKKVEVKFPQCIPDKDVQTKTGGYLEVSQEQIIMFFSDSGILTLCDPTTLEKHYIALFDGNLIKRNLNLLQYRDSQ